MKVLFQKRSQATHFSCFDSNLHIIYISSVSCFMTETTFTTGSFFPFSHFMNNVPFVSCLLRYYLFMKISRRYWTVVIFYVPSSVVPLHSLCVCVFFFLSLSLVPNLANLPSKESSKVDQAVADLDLRWGMLSPSPSQTRFLRKTLRDRRAGRFPYALPPPPHNLQ